MITCEYSIVGIVWQIPFVGVDKHGTLVYNNYLPVCSYLSILSLVHTLHTNQLVWMAQGVHLTQGWSVSTWYVYFTYSCKF